MIKNNSLEIYVHIPFCVKKCFYCDFLSMSADTLVQAAYMEALLKEISGRSKEYAEYEVTSIFFGGGTPSIVESKWIECLMNTIKQHYVVVQNAEITIEVNPGTTDKEKLQVFYHSGINRISIGLQSTNDELLRSLGRIHTYTQFEAVYSMARQIGFSNINVDLMSGLPQQTLEDYGNTIQTVLQLQPPPNHISAYSLIVEEGTPFGEQAQNGTLELPDEDVDRQMYELTKEMLEQEGYLRYEISNYALPGYECKHNCGYWKRVNYVGFGIGAASLVQNKRFSNSDNIQDYIKNPLATPQEHLLSKEEQIEEFIFLGLRLIEGVNKEEFFSIFGISIEDIYGEIISKNINNNLLSDKNGCILLTPKGLDISNYVMAQFLLEY